MENVFSFTLRELGGAVLLFSGLCAFVGAIWKNRIHLREKHEFDMALHHLKSEYEEQTQLLEHELQIQRQAAQLGHAELIVRRAAIIDDVYKLLVDLHEAIYDTIRPDYFGREKPSKQQAYDSALPKFDKFVDGFEKNKIYFSKETAGKVSDFYVSAAQTLDQARVAINSGETLGRGKVPNLLELLTKIDNDLSQSRKAVEQDFRNLLRVNEV